MNNLIHLILILLLSSLVLAQDINELPMYGGKPKSQEQLKSDQEFIADVTKEFGSREKAAETAIRLGCKYLAKNDWRAAMRRFNQAWLLTPENAGVDWGFGAALSYQGKFEESQRYFTKARARAPNNGRMLNDFGFMYQFWVTKGKVPKDQKAHYLDASIELFDEAARIEPDYDRIYFNWAVSLYFKEDYTGAWGKIKEAEKRGGGSIDQKFIKDLEGKMPKPRP